MQPVKSTINTDLAGILNTRIKITKGKEDINNGKQHTCSITEL